MASLYPPMPAPPASPSFPGATGRPYNPQWIPKFNPDGTVGTYVPPINQTWDESHGDQLKQLGLEADTERLFQLKHGYSSRGGPSAQARTSGAGGGTGGAAGLSIGALKNAITQLQPNLPPAVPLPNVPTSTVPRPSLSMDPRSEWLAYGQAKNKVAGEYGAANKALTRNMTARGISGTGVENRNRREMTRASLSALGNVAATQAAQRQAREDEFSKLGYTGDLTQRGQDIQALLARYSGALTQRGQDISALPNPVSYLMPLLALAQAGGSV